VAGLSAAERAAVFADTAARAYGIKLLPGGRAGSEVARGADR
jgi:hypothetical protein